MDISNQDNLSKYYNSEITDAEILANNSIPEYINNSKLLDDINNENLKPIKKDVYTGTSTARITTREKLKNFGKGFIKPFVEMFESPESFIKGAATIAAGVALSAVTKKAVLPVFAATGAAAGSIELGKSAYKANQAKTEEEAKEAWQGIGEGVSILGFSVAGAKTSLKEAGFDTKGLNPLNATFECFKKTPESIKNSFGAVKGKFFPHSPKPQKPSPSKPQPPEQTKPADKPQGEFIPEGDTVKPQPPIEPSVNPQPAAQTTVSSNQHSSVIQTTNYNSSAIESAKSTPTSWGDIKLPSPTVSSSKMKSVKPIEYEAVVIQPTPYKKHGNLPPINLNNPNPPVTAFNPSHKPVKPASTVQAQNAKIDIPTKINQNPKIQKQIEQLRNNATEIKTEEFSVNGQISPFEVLYGTQEGSNEAYYVVNKITGELFYAKEGTAQSRAELLASKLYNLAGLNAPEITSFTSAMGKRGILSRYIPDLKPVTTKNKAVNDDFGMDVLLANWDSKCSNNTCITPDKKSLIIDCGGTFDFRAQGESKPFTSIPTELTTLIDPDKNYVSAELFGTLTREDLIKSLQRAANLKNEDIISLTDSLKMSQYKENLIKRKQFIALVLETMKNTKQESNESILAYVQKCMNSALETTINQAKNLDELTDINQALKFINDKNIKSKLQNQVIAKQNELSKIKPHITSLSEDDVTNMLVKNGFRENQKGEYYFRVSDELYQTLKQKYGAQYSKQVKQALEKTLYPADIKNIQTMLNASEGKHIDFWQKNVQSFIYIYQNAKNSNIFDEMNLNRWEIFKQFNDKECQTLFSVLGLDEKNSGKFELLVNIAQKMPDKDTLYAMDTYKGSGHHDINEGLTNLKQHGTPLPKSVQKDVNALQSYLSTQILQVPVMVQRNEGYEVLRTVIMPNGQKIDLAKEMESAKYAFLQGDRKPVDKLITKYQNVVLKADQERFMSTAVSDCGVMQGDLHWEIIVEKGSKGAFLDGAVNSGLNYETELLLQKDSQIEILGFSFDDKKKIWNVFGKISN